MQLIRVTEGYQSKQPMAVCAGCFDGVHLGHQALIEKTIALSQQSGVLSACLTFEPYPKQYFAKQRHTDLLPRLSRFKDKYRVLEQLGLDRLVVCRFDDRLASRSPASFVDNILQSSLQVRHVVVGEDFRFGKKRQAGVTDLTALCQQRDISVSVVSPVLAEQGRVSSTQVRAALLAGDLTQVASLLGRPFTVSGCVRHGQKRGRLLGFPTANVHLPPDTLPMRGVFVVTLTRANGEVCPAVANVGAQPTVGQHHVRLEVHCLSFSGDLYNEQVQVTVLHRLRDVLTFSGLEALQQQIAADKAAAEAYFSDISDFE